MSIQAVVKQLFKLNDQDAEVTRECNYSLLLLFLKQPNLITLFSGIPLQNLQFNTQRTQHEMGSLCLDASM
jgi:hypothetical protein